MIPFGGGERTATLDIQPGPYEWSPDGAALHYIDSPKGKYDLWSQPLDGSAATRISDFDFSDEIGGFAWSQDGSNLVISRGHTSSDIVLLKNFR